MVHQMFRLLLTLCFLPALIHAHGRMADPPARNVMSLYGFPNPRNVNLNELNCGGSKNQWENEGGKCGLCGDPYQGPRRHEGGYKGGYANGIIGRVYQRKATIDVQIKITANHFGWFEFRLCPHNDPSTPITQSCLDKHLLASPTGETRHRLVLKSYKGTQIISLVLPDLTCSQCVLQWFWFAGNSRDRIPQETFVNCADVMLTNPDGSLDAGLVKPNILPQTSQVIPVLDDEETQLGQGKLIGLEGEWECDVVSPFDQGEKRQVYYDWCLENCLYSLPEDRSCPLDICRCYRTDKDETSQEERRLLGITSEQLKKAELANKEDEGRLEGDWDCSVKKPFNENPVKRKMFYDWCVENCILAKPTDRHCPDTHCKCFRTDMDLSSIEETELLKPIGHSVRASKKLGTLEKKDNQDWKSLAKLQSIPSGLPGTWDCDVQTPYDEQPDKRVMYYEWCLENCVNADPSDKHCPPTHCYCYRTDVEQSARVNLYQLTGEAGLLQEELTDSQEERGIPPSLLAIIEYAQQMDTVKSPQPGLEGEWDCDVLFPFNRGEKKDVYYAWCLENCIFAQPNDRHCPETHCYCYRKDSALTDQQAQQQLSVGYNVKNIIHAESGEEGSLATGDDKPTIEMPVAPDQVNENPDFGYTCEAVPPFNNGARGEEVVKFCYDGCVLSPAHQRNCPKSHCNCYETNNPSNKLKTYVAPSASTSNRKAKPLNRGEAIARRVSALKRMNGLRSRLG